jgi:probable F420-dependent oxidoreductase
MRKLDLGRLGIALNVSADEAYLHEAAEAELLGNSTIWLPGGQIDSLDLIAKIVRATATIGVASAVISPDVYEADAVLTLYAELQATAPDRVVVGLGGTQKPRSLAALNEYLDVLDAGEPPVPAERRLLAALGPRKLELARDRCAGAIALLVTPAYTRTARHILGEDSTLVVEQMLVLDTDAAHARETARGPLRFLSGVAGYLANFERMGFNSTDIADLSDRLVDDLVVWGDAAAIAERVREHIEAGADQVVLGVLNEGSQPGPIEVARQLAGELVG